MPIKVILANTLEAWEEDHGRELPTVQLAAALEVDEAELRALLDGQAESISFHLLDRLCLALACAPNDILRHLADPEHQQALADRLGGDLGTSIAG